MFLDLSKAFDCLDHSQLLRKLEYCGIRGVLLNWFLSYLSNRKQYVIIDDFKSELQQITCGVPQGSILGPLLFLLYINDLCNTSTVLKYVVFADDTTIYMSHSDPKLLQYNFNNELKYISDWFSANKLVVNS